jgi:hypothetical protein
MDKKHESTEEFPFKAKQLAHWMLEKYDKAAVATVATTVAEAKEVIPEATLLPVVSTTFSEI